MKKYLILSAACLLAACVTRPKPMVAISPNGPVPTSGGTLLGTNISTPKLGGSSSQKTRPYDLFNAWYKSSYNLSQPSGTAGDDEKRESALMLMYSGFEYSSLLCDSYFNLLANRNQDLGFGVESIGILGGFASAVLGLTDAPTKSVSLVATGFAATIAGMESYQQHYHFGPDVSAVRGLITTGQNNYKAAMTSDVIGTLDHYEAIRHIKSHQEICQVDSIKALVTAAVERQELTFQASNRDAFYQSTALSGIQAKLESVEGIDFVTAEQVVDLYWLLNVATSDAVRKEIRKDIGDELADVFMNSEGEFDSSKAQIRAEAASVLRTISPPQLKSKISDRAKEKNVAALTVISTPEAERDNNAVTLPSTSVNSFIGSLETKG